jgi:hypothetical protein
MHMRASAIALAVAVLGACAGNPEPPRRPVAPAVPAKPKRPPPPPEWTHWEPVEVSVHANVAPPDLPLADAMIVRSEGALKRWAAAPEWVRNKLESSAIAALPSQGKVARHGARYVELRETGTTFVITLDVLFHLAHLALDRALADAEDRVLAPSLELMLRRVQARLVAEQPTASADVAPAYATARGLVEVALALIGGPQAARDASPAAADELHRIRDAHGPAESPLLGVPIDYAALSLRGAAKRGEPRNGWFRATTWLGAAPLSLAASTEVRGGVASVARARNHARAGLLLAHALDPEVEPDAAAAYARWARLGKFVAGPTDDLSPLDFAEQAAKVRLDVRDPRALASVTLIDRLRHSMLDQKPPRIFDGGGGPRVPSVRLLGPRLVPDAEVFQGLVHPAVGSLRAGAAPATASEGKRALPTALDLGAWLGSPEARLALHETGDDAYEGFDAALEALYQRRPGENDAIRHASVYMSFIDAIATYLAPSAADRAQPVAQTAAWRRRKLEVGLAAWTALRHDVVPFSRAPSAPPRPILVNKTSTTGVIGYVEPHPEAIAKLVALVRQIARGFEAQGAIPADGFSRPVLREVLEILDVAFRVAQREGNDQAPTTEESAQLAALPQRIAELEAKLGPVAETPLAIDVHVDAAGDRVLEEATGYLDDLALVLREPASGRMVLAYGPGVSTYELPQPASQRFGDESWRARLDASPPPRRSFTESYVFSAQKP